MQDTIYNESMALSYSARSEEVVQAHAVPRGHFAVVVEEGGYFGHLAYCWPGSLLDLVTKEILNSDIRVRVLYRGDAFAVSVK